MRVASSVEYILLLGQFRVDRPKGSRPARHPRNAQQWRLQAAGKKSGNVYTFEATVAKMSILMNLNQI
jgi:hypothetical protein